MASGRTSGQVGFCDGVVLEGGVGLDWCPKGQEGIPWATQLSNGCMTELWVHHLA